MANAAPHSMAQATGPDDAPVILSNEPGSFAWGVLHERHPALIRKVQGAFPYTPEQNNSLDRLLEEITDGVIEPIEEHAYDYASWQSWGLADQAGKPWRDAPFLWAESYFYRRLLAAVGYFDPGPWQGVDPFEPFKTAELHGEQTASELRALDAVVALSGDERNSVLLQLSLWGNRADLGFRVSAGDTASAARESHLVVDDTARLWAHLDCMESGRVCIVADNAGRELLPDLVLIDHLLTSGRATEVVVHVKPHPYYVSDATLADVVACLRLLREADKTGQRLWRAAREGRLILRAHPFSCAPLPYSDMPQDLGEDFASASLTIMKGDLNYRRLVGDRMWRPIFPFEQATAYFPGPVAASRTLKSDVVVGLDSTTVAVLESSGQPWRTSGTHALVQVSLPPADRPDDPRVGPDGQGNPATVRG